MTEWNQLLERAKWGVLSEAEVERVAQELRRPKSNADRYTLLYILGKANAQQYRQTVESYLEIEGDAMLARLALQILCDFWGQADRYVQQLSRFAEGVPWDSEGYARQMAISIAGRYLSSRSDPKLLRQLIRTFEEDNDPLARDDAYRALARAVGRAGSELPTAARPLRDADIDPTILEEARQLLSAGER